MKAEFYQGQNLEAILIENVWIRAVPGKLSTTSDRDCFCKSITVIMESGQMSGVPWAFVKYADGQVEKYNLALVTGVSLGQDKEEQIDEVKEQVNKNYPAESTPYLISSHLLDRVLEKWSRYQQKVLSKEGGREKLLQDWSTHIDRMIRIDKIDPSEIIDVIEWAQDNDFWWKNILSTDKLRKQYDKLLIESGIGKVSKKDLVSPDLELTDLLLSTYKLRIDSKNFNPTSDQQEKFIEATKKMIKYFTSQKKSIVDKTMWVKYLFLCLEDKYTNCGDPLLPGHLSSDFTWNVLMPQYLVSLGVEE